MRQDVILDDGDVRWILGVGPVVALRRELDEAPDRRVAAVVEARDLAADLDAQDGRDLAGSRRSAASIASTASDGVPGLKLHEHHVAHA